MYINDFPVVKFVNVHL